MTKIQKAACIVMSFFFFAALAYLPGLSYLWENVYRQLPLYCFLEDRANSLPLSQDPETYELLEENNAAYLGKLAEENRQEIQMEQEENLSAETAVNGESGGETTDIAADGEKESAEMKNTAETENNAASQSAEEEKSEAGQAIEKMITESDAENEGKTEDRTETEMEQEESPSAETAVNGDAAGETGNAAAEAGDSAKNSELAADEAADGQEAPAASAAVQPSPVIDLAPETLADYDYLLNNFFIVDDNTATNAGQLNAAAFLGEDLTLKKDASAPQILIYHSHSQEAFADSREGEAEDTIVGVGNYLAELLTEDYGYQVMHVTEAFDMKSGELDRSKAYDYAREYVEPLLAENPSIEVVIDLHRDGVPENRRLVTTINGKDTAQIMFYNGLSYTVNSGTLDYLPNPYIQDNLAFSFQLEYQAALYYPELYRGIYLAGLRYNLHLKPRALLLEAGAQTNTVQEVKNAMEPFADILNRVLSGE